MTEQVFRPSRLKAIGIAVGCFVCYAATLLLLGESSVFNAISQGGTLAKIAIANLVFAVLVPVACCKAVLQPATLTINDAGLEERGVFGQFRCEWNEIQRVEIAKVNGMSFVAIQTAQKVKHLAPGYGPNARQLADTIASYRQQVLLST